MKFYQCNKYYFQEVFLKYKISKNSQKFKLKKDKNIRTAHFIKKCKVNSDCNWFGLRKKNMFVFFQYLKKNKFSSLLHLLLHHLTLCLKICLF